MPSFDIASKMDLQNMENAVNNVVKELKNRYDFKDSLFKSELNKKENFVIIAAESEMKLKQIEDILISKSIKQNIDPKSLHFTGDIKPNGKLVEKKINLQNGLSKEDSKKITKIIKDNGFKVQVAIMEDIIRVTSKKIDDLQLVIKHLPTCNLEFPLQFINMKS